MATNVFGTPITNEELLGLSEYPDADNITNRDRAKVASHLKNAGGKDVRAHQYLEAIVAHADVERGRYTMCLIYNATGNTIEFVKDWSWKGALQETPYPIMIENGQWGAFLHGPWKGGENESKAGVVYKGKNSDGCTYHFLLSWYNHQTKNRVYVETRLPGHYDNEATWGTLSNLLDNSNLVCMEERNGFRLIGSIGDSTVHTSLEAIVALGD